MIGETSKYHKIWGLCISRPPALAPNLYLYPGQDLTTITTATCTITTTTTTTTITTANNENNNNNNTHNKRYLRGCKIRIKWPLECI